MVKYEVQMTYSVMIDVDSDSEELAYTKARIDLEDSIVNYEPTYYEVLPGEE